jgi:hypothetical protein
MTRMTILSLDIKLLNSFVICLSISKYYTDLGYFHRVTYKELH